MRFELTDEQRGFASSLDDLLGAAETTTVARAWAAGEHETGLKLWKRLANLGVHGLCIPESAGGLGATALDVVVAFEQLGRHLAPGPYIESVALAPALLAAAGAPTSDRLASMSVGTTIITLAVPPHTPYALDADIATSTLLLGGSRLTELTEAAVGPLHRSVDASRRLFSVTRGDDVATLDPTVVEGAMDFAVLACTAQLLGAGERLLTETVEYAKARTQFGRPIGQFQALKHAMADVRVALDFARPLVYGAALSAGSADGSRDVSAAKVAVGDAAYSASRVALQVHGAIGYTAEHDLGLAITKVRALFNAWGTASLHRARVLASLVERPESTPEPTVTKEA